MNKIRNVLIVYKKSSYESNALDKKDENYLRLLREKSLVLQKSKNTHDIHVDTFETIKGFLDHLSIPFDIRLRYELKPIRGYDLVLTIGGDGTFLETSHYLEEGILMGINSVPEESIGYYCKATSENFLEKIYQYLKGKCPLKTLHRLEMSLDGKRTGPYALNDILFANQNPAGTTRYLLKVGKSREEQKSSGLWISPAPGSTAATKSAGGRKLPLTSSHFQYVVREPYYPHGRRYRMIKQVLSPQAKVEITSMMDDAVLFIDGPHRAFPVRRGSTIQIQSAKKPILAIW